MMLRSSSTPVLGSLLSSISPENHHHHRETTVTAHKTSPIHKFSHHFTPLSCTSFPISPSVSNGGIRRAQSDGNLEGLLNSGGDDEFSFFTKKHSTRPHCCLLETIPSFSYENSRFRSEDDESGDDDEVLNGFRGFDMEKKVMDLKEQMGFGNLAVKDEITNTQMYLAKGIGVDVGFAGGDGSGGRNLSPAGRGGGGDGGDVEEHYRKMVNDNPENSLFLRNYAEFLYQSKKDLEGAEEYYSRAILVDPNDGEILSQYAKIIWELHHDKDRATNYYERAIQEASEDSHVHAAYASFLWEIEREEDEDEADEG